MTFDFFFGVRDGGTTSKRYFEFFLSCATVSRTPSTYYGQWPSIIFSNFCHSSVSCALRANLATSEQLR